MRSSLMRFSDPLKRKMPSTSVAMVGVSAWHVWLLSGRTLLFQIDTAFGDDYRNITIDIALALFVEQRNGDVCVTDAGLEWDAKDALGSCATKQRISM